MSTPVSLYDSAPIATLTLQNDQLVRVPPGVWAVGPNGGGAAPPIIELVSPQPPPLGFLVVPGSPRPALVAPVLITSRVWYLRSWITVRARYTFTLPVGPEQLPQLLCFGPVALGEEGLDLWYEVAAPALGGATIIPPYGGDYSVYSAADASVLVGAFGGNAPFVMPAGASRWFGQKAGL